METLNPLSKFPLDLVLPFFAPIISINEEILQTFGLISTPRFNSSSKLVNYFCVVCIFFACLPWRYVLFSLHACNRLWIPPVSIWLYGKFLQNLLFLLFNIQSNCNCCPLPALSIVGCSVLIPAHAPTSNSITGGKIIWGLVVRLCIQSPRWRQEPVFDGGLVSPLMAKLTKLTQGRDQLCSAG